MVASGGVGSVCGSPDQEGSQVLAVKSAFLPERLNPVRFLAN